MEEYQPKKAETLEDLNRKLRKKESQAFEYKEKGMNISYGLMLEEIANINFKIKKLQMGSK